MHSIVDFLNKAILLVQHVPSGFWQALIASGVLSPALKVWKHFRVTKKEKQIGEAVMFAVVTGISFVAVVLNYLFTHDPQNPSIILLHTAVLGFMTQPVYYLGVKPLWAKIEKEVAKAEALNEAVKAAAIPPEGLPVADTTVSAQEALHNSITQDNFTN